MKFPVKKYDSDHDVLHVYLSRRCNLAESSAEEKPKNVYVLYDDETDEITGFKILDYKKNVSEARKLYPQYDFSFSDISVIAPELNLAAVNLSSGYYNAHTLHEYINREHLENTISKVLEIISDAAQFDFPNYEYRQLYGDTNIDD